jgi:hypothetical protein
MLVGRDRKAFDALFVFVICDALLIRGFVDPNVVLGHPSRGEALFEPSCCRAASLKEGRLSYRTVHATASAHSRPPCVGQIPKAEADRAGEQQR